MSRGTIKYRYRVGLCADCGRIRVVTIEDRYIFKATCDDSVDHAAIEWIDGDGYEGFRILLNIMVYSVLISLRDSGTALYFAISDSNFNSVMLETVNKIMEVDVHVKDNVYCLVRKGSTVGESFVEQNLGKGHVKHGLKGEDIPHDDKSITRLGICPHCGLVLTVETNNAWVEFFKVGEPVEKKRFNEEYFHELGRIAYFFITKEVIIRLMIYGTCILNQNLKTITALKFAMDMTWFNAFEFEFNNEMYYLVTSNDGMKEGAFKMGYLKRIDVLERYKEKWE